MSQLRLYKPYRVTKAATSNASRKPKISEWQGKTVYLRKNNPTRSDIPTFEHGFVHVYDYKTKMYLGYCGVTYFKAIIGL